MANTDLSLGGFNQALPAISGRGLITQENIVNFDATKGGTNRAQNLVMNLFVIPKGTLVLGVTVEILVQVTASVTIDIGDWSNAATEIVVLLDGWLDGGNVVQAAGTILGSRATVTLTEGGPNTLTPVYAFGKQYIVNNYIAFKVLGAEAVVGKLRFRAFCML